MTNRTESLHRALPANGERRRSILKQLAGAAATTLVPGAVLAQGTGKFNMKIAISIPESHPTTAALKAACAEILSESKGRLTIDVYPNGQLGSDTSHVWDCFTLVGNKRNWNALPEDLRQLATRILDAHALKQRAAHATLNTTLEAKLKGFGMQFNTVDAKPFREVLQKSGYYADWQKKFGAEAWALLEKYSGKLA